MIFLVNDEDNKTGPPIERRRAFSFSRPVAVHFVKEAIFLPLLVDSLCNSFLDQVVGLWCLVWVSQTILLVHIISLETSQKEVMEVYKQIASIDVWVEAIELV